MSNKTLKDDIEKAERHILVFSWVGVFLGVVSFLLFFCTPQPPPGICDSNGTAEQCVEWWQDVMERP